MFALRAFVSSQRTSIVKRVEGRCHALSTKFHEYPSSSSQVVSCNWTKVAGAPQDCELSRCGNISYAACGTEYCKIISSKTSQNKNAKCRGMRNLIIWIRISFWQIHKVEVKLILCLSNEYTKKMYGRVEIYFRIFLTSAEDGCEWPAWRSTRGKSPRHPLDKILGGPQSRFGLEAVEKCLLPLKRIEVRFLCHPDRNLNYKLLLVVHHPKQFCSSLFVMWRLITENWQHCCSM
jgi:hypothetical protein